MTKIITCTGYGGTGSSAITDLLKEFDNGVSLGDIEFWLLQDYDGIRDLEYFLIDGNHRSKVSLAVKRFKRYIEKNKKFYNRYFTNEFEQLTEQYIDSLIDAKFKKALSLYEVENSFFKLLFFKLIPYSQIIMRKILKLNNFEFSPYLPTVNKYYSIPDKDRFYRETKQYINSLFNKINNNYSFIAIDQLVPAMGIERYFNYIDNMKVVVIDRDPRDLYLLNEIVWKQASYICDTSDVDSYIDWYRSMREHRHLEKENSNILYINFEELIYEYDQTLEKLYNFFELEENTHIWKRKYFNPSISITNTKLWERYSTYKPENISKIKDALNEYCYR